MADPALAGALIGGLVGLAIGLCALVLYMARHRWMHKMPWTKSKEAAEDSEAGSTGNTNPPIEPHNTALRFDSGISKDGSVRNATRRGSVLSTASDESTVVMINGDQDSDKTRRNLAEGRPISSLLSSHERGSNSVPKLKKPLPQAAPVSIPPAIPLPGASSAKASSPVVVRPISEYVDPRRASVSVTEILASYSSRNENGSSIYGSASSGSEVAGSVVGGTNGDHQVGNEVVQNISGHNIVPSLNRASWIAGSEVGMLSDGVASPSESKPPDNKVDSEVHGKKSTATFESSIRDDESSISLYSEMNERGLAVGAEDRRTSWSSKVSVVDSEVLIEEVRRKTLTRGARR
ncbi:hypothetical protein HDU78_006088 [Chytriomyces hyalinus]|nr:hypothetical protein HDU78_006088 [Chytriomyces hyalinus]KAJ3250852.1 hypothetical protein HDU77_006309 [Chytriomyces hyalinus]